MSPGFTQPTEETNEFSSTGSSGTSVTVAEPAGVPSGAAQSPSLPSVLRSSEVAPTSWIETVSR